MSCESREYVVFEDLIKNQMALIEKYKNKEEYNYYSVVLLTEFHLIVENIEIKQLIKKRYLDFYKTNYRFEDIEFILSIIDRILDINVIVETNEIIASKWIVVNNTIMRKEYKLIRNDYNYLIEHLNEYTYSSYKEIK